TDYPTAYPTGAYPTDTETDYPTVDPTGTDTVYPTDTATVYPTDTVTDYPTAYPTGAYPTDTGSDYPTVDPTGTDTVYPTGYPTGAYPTDDESDCPEIPYPTDTETDYPTVDPTGTVTDYPTAYPTVTTQLSILPALRPGIPPVSTLLAQRRPTQPALNTQPNQHPQSQPHTLQHTVQGESVVQPHPVLSQLDHSQFTPVTPSKPLRVVGTLQLSQPHTVAETDALLRLHPLLQVQEPVTQAPLDRESTRQARHHQSTPPAALPQHL
ncbi:hypothetical protein GX51_08315, partial [Blastomyces parvus]